MLRPVKTRASGVLAQCCHLIVLTDRKLGYKIFTYLQ